VPATDLQLEEWRELPHHVFVQALEDGHRAQLGAHKGAVARAQQRHATIGRPQPQLIRRKLQHDARAHRGHGARATGPVQRFRTEENAVLGAALDAHELNAVGVGAR
jgi:hypothetical protein